MDERVRVPVCGKSNLVLRKGADTKIGARVFDDP